MRSLSVDLLLRLFQAPDKLPIGEGPRHVSRMSQHRDQAYSQNLEGDAPDAYLHSPMQLVAILYEIHMFIYQKFFQEPSALMACTIRLVISENGDVIAMLGKLITYQLSKR